MQVHLLARTVLLGVTCVHACGPPRPGQAGRAPAFPRLRMPVGLRPGPRPGPWACAPFGLSPWGREWG